MRLLVLLEDVEDERMRGQRGPVAGVLDRDAVDQADERKVVSVATPLQFGCCSGCGRAAVAVADQREARARISLRDSCEHRLEPVFSSGVHVCRSRHIRSRQECY